MPLDPIAAAPDAASLTPAGPAGVGAAGQVPPAWSAAPQLPLSPGSEGGGLGEGGFQTEAADQCLPGLGRTPAAASPTDGRAPSPGRPEKFGLSVRERLERLIDKSGDCWVWLGARTRNGYGDIVIEGKHVAAHRAAYVDYVGPIPGGLVLDHLCRNRACVNPAHVEAVTFKENVLRGRSFSAINAAKTHCPQGHEFSPENTIRRPCGRRRCKECERIRDARRPARNKRRAS